MTRPKRLAIYPGTFDPVTNGHLDILSRAAQLFDEIIVALAKNSSKSPLFGLEERIALLETVLKEQPYRKKVRVEAFAGLLVNFARKKGAKILVRGLRATSDFEYEFQMALMNRHQASDIETVFLMPHERFVYLSSSIVREVGRLRGNLRDFLPQPVIAALHRKFPA